MTQEIVALEVAESEFERMCAAHSIDTSDRDIEEEAKEFAETKAKIVRAMQSGRLIVDESGLPTYQPRTAGGGELKFHPATGLTMMLMGEKNDGGVSRLVRGMQDMTRSAPGTFAKLELADFKLCIALATLFLNIEP